MPQSLVVQIMHIVFSTKLRLPMITPDLENRLYKYLGGLLRHLGCRLIEIGGEKDHIHLLVSQNKTLSVAELVNRLKTASSKWIHQDLNRRKFAWQTGYAAFSVSESEVPRVRRYVRDQKEHHKKRSFKEELRELLRKHGVDFDERYLWD